jgi:hypothetical protein
MLRLHHCALLAAAVSLAACATNQPPVAWKTDNQPQQSANTVRDWDKVAGRITSELAQRGMLIAPKEGATPATPPWGPYYVHVQVPRSTFLQSVGESLRTNIVNAGGAIARSPAGAVVINLDADFIKHGPREQPAGGEATAIGTAVAAGAAIAGGTPYANPWIAAAVAGGSALALGILTDAYISQYPMMNGETTWRATIVSPQQALMRVSGTLYVSTGDLRLYVGDVKLAEMSTPGAAANLQVKRMRYAGGYAPAAAPASPPPCPANCVPPNPAQPATR